MNTSGDVAAPEPIVAPAVLRAVPTIGKRARAELKGQTPLILWMTGLSGAGKSTIATRVEERLWRCGHHTMLLDGDNLRFGLNSDLTFTDAARIENIRRTAEVARLMLDAGLIVICSLISPFRRERMLARQLVGAGEFSRGLRRRAPRPVQTARSQGALCPRARRADPELHWHLLALRAAGGAGDPSADGCRRRRRPGRAGLGRAAAQGRHDLRVVTTRTA